MMAEAKHTHVFDWEDGFCIQECGMTRNQYRDELESQRAALLAALKAVEWVWSDAGGGFQHCPSCAAYWGLVYPKGKHPQEQKDDHATDCQLAAAIRLAEPCP